MTTYRTTDLSRWGAGKGANLTPTEVDLNFWDIVQQIAELSGTTGVGIDYITQSGAELTIHLTDHTTQGPFTIPTSTWTFLGAWQPLTNYIAYDVVTNNGSTYLVLYPHTSAATFSPTASDGSGHDYYGLILTNPASALPSGGTTNQVLAKVDDSDFNLYWLTVQLEILSDVALVSPLDAGHGLVWNGLHWSNSPVVTVTVGSPLYDGDAVVWDSTLEGYTTRRPVSVPQTQGGVSWTPSIDDAYTYNRFTSSSPITVSIPPSASVDFAIGTEIHGRQAGTGTITIEALSGVTLNSQDGSLNQTSGQGATFTIKKVDTDEWDVMGHLAVSSP